MKHANVWLDTLIAAIKAKEDHTRALAALIKEHGGKRTIGLMEQLCAGMHCLFPKTDAVVSVYMGQPNVSFPSKGAGYETWRTLIAPSLPKIKARTTPAASSNKQVSEKRLISLAASMKQKYGKAACRTLGALLLS